MKTRWAILSLLLLAFVAGSQAINRNTYPLPEDRGTAATLSALEKLPVYARILQTTAHPDDESAGTLTWLSRKFHAQTALFCLTRGEGGQNILGSEKYEELGLVRSGELLEACRYYGVDLYFAGAIDFGFSKTAEETLSRWGYEATLGEMVRFIRTWRPSVILSRFQGTPADGHGHHQAAGILTKEALHAAGDPARYPNQLSSGLHPWKVKKLYVSSQMAPVPGNAESTASSWTVRVPVGDYDPALGMSCREIAAEGYSKHRTQGNGPSYALPGRSYEYFKLEDPPAGAKSKEDGFFDSIDTSLNAIADLAGTEKPSLPFLEKNLSEAQEAAVAALRLFQATAPEKCAPAVAEGAAILGDTIRRVENALVTPLTKDLLLDALHAKLKDFQSALRAALGIYFIARSEDVTGIPGEKLPVTLSFYNRGTETVSLKRLDIFAPGAASRADPKASYGKLGPGSSATVRYTVDISRDAKVTEPFWHATSGAARYKVETEDNPFAPFGKPEISAEAVYIYRNTEFAVRADAEAQAGGPLRGSDFVQFQIVPAVSVTLEPDLQIAPVKSVPEKYRFRVTVLNNQKGETHGTLKLEAGNDWNISPLSAEFRLARKGETFTTSFVIQIPAGTREGDYTVAAVATAHGQEYRRGYHIISYPENWTRNFYFPARSKVERFGIKAAPGLTVGYIPGAGDDVQGALELLGVKVQTLSASNLAFDDLSRFPAIVTGIRAYNVNDDLRANNRRLLEYVFHGGTLIVQYVRPMERPARGSTGSPFPFGPYPMSVSDSDRITVEDSPVKMLASENPVFTHPNKITEADFRGWVQERGLYFSDTWDSHYVPLLSGNDPGEKPKNGGMLYAHYGKGHYIYTGYAWFRQLPAGVPGAFRIFANMLSLGQTAAK
jgi:LmbE family N-acetylglucosaminyl deacetylase